MSSERIPTLAALGLAAAVAVVAILPAFRDARTLDALEGAASGAARSDGPAAPGRREHAAGGGATTASSAKEDAPPPKAASQEEVDRAGTVADLTTLAERYPDDVRILTKLARVQAAQADGLLASLATMRKLFTLDAQSMKNVELITILKRATAAPAPASDLAFDIMTTSMGPTGVDVLFELGSPSNSSKIARDRAISLTRQPAVREKASPALLIALELRDASGCGRKPLFARAAKEADARSLQYLTPLTSTKGCGVFSLGDCFDGCLGNRKELNETITAIKSRAN